MTATPGSDGSYDVIVAGGGPGGAALATLLAREGYRCLILERANFPRYHVGESLIPHTYGIFERLGLLTKLKASSFPEKHSVRFVPPGGRESTPFYFSERLSDEASRTWQVERSQFDRMLLDHARENGVEVREGVRAEGVMFEDDRAVGIRGIQQGGETFDVHARVVVDATGAATLIGRQLGLRRDIPTLRKGVLWGYYRGGARLPGIDAGETTIFLMPEDGWFWYIPLPDDVVSVGIVASPEYLFGVMEESETIFSREIERCTALKERLSRASCISRIRSISQLAYLNRQTCGDGWMMIGDARAFLDPIYSSGLYLALASAELAAASVHEALKEDDVSASRLGQFEPKLSAGVDTIGRLIHAFYDRKFSFRDFVERFPEQRSALIDCLMGDVIDKDMTSFTAALAQMTPPPPALDDSL